MTFQRASGQFLNACLETLAPRPNRSLAPMGSLRDTQYSYQQLRRRNEGKIVDSCGVGKSVSAPVSRTPNVQPRKETNLR
jgi:hypothetical protein